MTEAAEIAGSIDHATQADNAIEENVRIADPLTESEFKKELLKIAPHLRAFARSLCGCRDRADDLAQETMLKAWAARDRYQRDTNFKAWSFTILRNQFFGEARRGRFHGDYDELVAERILCAPASQESALELSDVVRAFAMLPETQREILILAGVGGMSYEEMEEICGVAAGTIKSRLSRARTAIQKLIDGGQLADSRHDFVMGGNAVQSLFAMLATIVNNSPALRAAA
jgi:RNA polymerase sigma-70 factor (ECF subfamily)